jgi:hypothetical protein
MHRVLGMKLAKPYQGCKEDGIGIPPRHLQGDAYSKRRHWPNAGSRKLKRPYTVAEEQRENRPAFAHALDLGGTQRIWPNLALSLMPR